MQRSFFLQAGVLKISLQNKTPGIIPGVWAEPFSSEDLRRLRSNLVCFFNCLTRAEACLDLSFRRLPLRGDSQDFNLIKPSIECCLNILASKSSHRKA
jgi:hypothetical protein